MNLRTLLVSLILIAFHIIFICPIHVYARVAQRLDVTVEEIKGDVEIMPPDTTQWLVPEAGGSFAEGTQIRTGPFSSISLFLADSSVVVVDSLTYMTVEKFFKSGNLVTTRINLIVGSTVNTLNDKAPLENDYQIITPSVTIPLSRNEIKKVVAGAMYSDTVRTGYRNRGNTDNNRNRSGGASQKEESAGQIAQETGVKRESSMTPTK